MYKRHLNKRWIYRWLFYAYTLWLRSKGRSCFETCYQNRRCKRDVTGRQREGRRGELQLQKAKLTKLMQCNDRKNKEAPFIYPKCLHRITRGLKESAALLKVVGSHCRLPLRGDVMGVATPGRCVNASLSFALFSRDCFSGKLGFGSWAEVERIERLSSLNFIVWVAGKG